MILLDLGGKGWREEGGREQGEGEWREERVNLKDINQYPQKFL